MAYPTTLNNQTTSHAAGQVVASADDNSQSTDINALGVKVGSGTSVPTTVGHVLMVTSAGASAWQASGAGSGYATVQDEGSPLTARSAINFVGAGVTATDSGSATTVTISGTAGGQADLGWVVYGGTAGSVGAATANVAAFAAAIAALPATGGTIFVKAGTYWINNVCTVPTGNTRIRGEPGSIFKLTTAANQVAFVIGNQAAYITGVVFEGIEIDGNAINQSPTTTSGLATTYGVIGILCLKLYQSTIRDCYIHDTLGSGVQVNSCGQIDIKGNTIQNVGMVRSYSRGGAITGVANVTNPVVTTATPHNLVNGQLVTIAGVAGAMGTAVNGNWTVSAAGTIGVSTTYTITRAVPGASYTSGGTTAYAGFYQCNSISIYQDSLDGGLHPAYGFHCIGNSIIGVCDNGVSANGNGSQGYVIADNDISGRVTDLTSFAAAYWGIAVELETGDTIADHLCAITGNIVKDQGTGIILVQYPSTGSLVLQGVSIDGNTISNTAIAFSICGQNITVTGNTAFLVNEFLSTNGDPDDAAVVNRAWVIANNSYTLSTTGGLGFSAGIAGGIILRVQPHAILDGIVIANNSGVGTGTSNLNSWHAGIVLELGPSPVTSAIKNVTITGNQFRNFGMGVWVKSPDPVMISGNHCIQNGDSGIALTGFTNVGSVITSNVCVDNGRDAGATWSAGIEIDCSDAMLRDNRCYDTASSGKLQQYGVRVSGSTVLSTMNGDDLRGNASGTIGFLGNSSFTTIRNVRGVNPIGTIALPRTGPTNTIPATPIAATTYTNDTGYDCTVYYTSGTGLISVGGTSTGLVNGAIRVKSGQTVAQATGGTLSWKWFAD